MTVFQCLIKNITLTSNSDGWKMWLEVTLGPSKKDLGRATAHDVVLSGKLRINQFLFCVDQECFKWEINILRAQGVRPRQWALCPGWHWKNGRSVFVATGWLRLVHTPWFSPLACWEDPSASCYRSLRAALVGLLQYVEEHFQGFTLRQKAFFLKLSKGEHSQCTRTFFFKQTTTNIPVSPGTNTRGAEAVCSWQRV